jgi:hypothetical protein
MKANKVLYKETNEDRRTDIMGNEKPTVHKVFGGDEDYWWSPTVKIL